MWICLVCKWWVDTNPTKRTTTKMYLCLGIRHAKMVFYAWKRTRRSKYLKLICPVFWSLSLPKEAFQSKQWSFEFQRHVWVCITQMLIADTTAKPSELFTGHAQNPDECRIQPHIISPINISPAFFLDHIYINSNMKLLNFIIAAVWWPRSFEKNT